MDENRTERVGIIMNGVTGRMGTNQHLIRSLVPIIEQGGLDVGDGETIVPDLVLAGRNEKKLKDLCARTGIEKWSTDVDALLSDRSYDVYFDAQTTDRRPAAVRKAIAAGKHVYMEKPTATTLEEAVDLWRVAVDAGVKHGVVQDKLWLPGMMKLRALRDSGFFGRIFAVRGEFGYWVFEGDRVKAQRPSWNYRAEDGGGIIPDMVCHWRYLLDDLFGAVKSITCRGATHIHRRWDEEGQPYECTAEDAAYATFELEGDITAHFNSSWATRVRRDELLMVHVDGTEGSAVAGLRRCWAQPYGETPMAVWNPDIADVNDYCAQWEEIEPDREYTNAFRAQWELFLRHIVRDEPFEWGLLEGAKGVQLADLARESWTRRAWMDIPSLDTTR